MKALYKATVTSTGGGRNGKVKSSDGALDLDVKSPAEMGGPGGPHTNPEQLFAAGYAACLASAIAAVAGQKRIIVAPRVTANVTLWKDEESGFRLSVEMDVNIPGVDKPVAEEIVAGGHAMCPYSKAIRGNVDVTLNVTND